MSHSTTSDLVSTIATQLNIVIVALRLLVDMILNPDATSPADTIPGSCPSRPPASPASPLFQTTTRPSISWAPCEQPVHFQTLSRTPPPSPTSAAGSRTPPALPSSPAFCSTFHPPFPFPSSRRCRSLFTSPTFVSPFSRSLPSGLCLPTSLHSGSPTLPLPFLFPRLFRLPWPPSFSPPQTPLFFPFFFPLPYLSPCLSSPSLRHLLGR